MGALLKCKILNPNYLGILVKKINKEELDLIARFEVETKELGLSALRRIVCIILYLQGPMAVSDLEENIPWSIKHLRNALKKLEDSGFIVTERKPFRPGDRTTIVRLELSRQVYKLIDSYSYALDFSRYIDLRLSLEISVNSELFSCLSVYCALVGLGAEGEKSFSAAQVSEYLKMMVIEETISHSLLFGGNQRMGLIINALETALKNQVSLSRGKRKGAAKGKASEKFYKLKHPEEIICKFSFVD